jgi:hypothetical protein
MIKAIATGTIKNLAVKGTASKFVTGNIVARDEKNWFKASMPVVCFDEEINAQLMELSQSDGYTEEVVITGEVQTRLDKDRKRAPWTQIVIESIRVNA